MGWHEIYVKHVLRPRYDHEAWCLARHILDAMTAHVLAVRRLPLASGDQAQQDIERLLQAIGELRASPPPEYAPDLPELYTAFVRRLEELAGVQAVSYLRLGLSRNDLYMTVYRMRARELALGLGRSLVDLRSALVAQAERHLDTVMIAQTHHQPAQPTTLAHYLDAAGCMVARDLERLLEAYSRLNVCPLGAAALAGTGYGLDRAYVADLLGFEAPATNTYDAIAASDWQTELAGVAQICATNLSRLVADLIHWAADGVLELPDSLVETSSIMPQKRNPAVLEHVRSALSRVLGGCQVVVNSSHNIPYGDHNDFGPDVQGSLEALMRELTYAAVDMLAVCLREGTFDTRRLAAEAAASDAMATELADHLVRANGVPFQEAHRLARALVDRLRRSGRKLAEAQREDLALLGGPALEDSEIRLALDPVEFVRRRRELGGPAKEVMQENIRLAHQEIQAVRQRIDRLEARLAQSRQAITHEGG